MPVRGRLRLRYWRMYTTSVSVELLGDLRSPPSSRNGLLHSSGFACGTFECDRPSAKHGQIRMLSTTASSPRSLMRSISVSLSYNSSCQLAAQPCMPQCFQPPQLFKPLTDPGVRVRR